ncbi:hypothetical protein CIL05_03630 [Virgibacillus profundi]|uniref:Sugar kinase n=1 Tax=Virgibacillus profundi TaxID=2024555 RepID=A0A2A2IIA0_9BACI|nr:ROK family protein [Virgibacillus profundi]PAV30823.1 hypothetical protein CIL05_03630 [Virgibacillus profundi]PXY55006.1 ROK family protein [Virgibacillus profundi]
MGHYLSIDIGGTYIKYALIDERHRLYHHQKTKTPENIDQAILKQIDTIVEAVADKHNIDGIGISTAGIVDREKGEIIYAGPTIKDYKDTAFKRELTEKYKLPVHVENDVNAALLGEIWKGAARNQNNVFCITLGTGIGGAYYDHQLMDGSHHQANSVGYLLYEPETRTNYEGRASTAALNKLIAKELGEEISAIAVFERAKNGDETCSSIIQSWTKEVAKGLSQIILLTDPKCILIGGGVSAQGDYLLEQIQNQLELFLPDNFLKTELKIAELFNDAALYGAVYPFFDVAVV